MSGDVKATGSDTGQTNFHRGRLFIISAPSGAGKTTLIKAVLKRFPDILYSISHTTRSLRQGETDGVDYHFVSKKQFEECIKDNKWAEWAKVHGNYYGTSADFIDESLSTGCDVLLDIDVQGAFQLLEHYPQSITIFIMPPSLDALKQRLESRGTDNKAAIEKRILNAASEMARKDLYRHIIVNDQLSDAVEELISIVEKNRILK